MSEFAQNIIGVAAIATALITILTLFTHLGKAISWLMRLPTEIRHFLFRPKLILLPTAEEIAAYSVKSFESARITQAEIEEELRSRNRYAARRKEIKQKSRTASAILVFGAAFMAIEVVLFTAATNNYQYDWSRSAIAYSFMTTWFFITIFSSLALFGYYFWIRLGGSMDNVDS